jgi:sporulation protein YqfC
VSDQIKKFAYWIDVPREVATYSPLITLEDKTSITIENHLGLKQYSSTEIRVLLNKMTLLICGCNLIIDYINNEKICIKGEIIVVKYLF